MAEELTFNEEYEKLTTGTRAHADNFNKIFDLLLENDKFLKYAADSLSEKMIEKGMIVDNFATQIKGFIPDATLVTQLKEAQDEQNKNINASKVPVGSIKDFAIGCKKGITVFSTNSSSLDLPAQTSEWLNTDGFVIKRDDTGNTFNVVLFGYLTGNMAILSYAAQNWSNWETYTKNSDLKDILIGRTVPTSNDANDINLFGGYYFPDTTKIANLPTTPDRAAFMLVFGQYSGANGRYCQLLLSGGQSYKRYFIGIYTEWY